MRRLFSIAAAVLAIALVPSPAHAAPAAVTGAGWMPSPSQPYDQPAGARCDFPIHVQPIRDEVRFKVLATYPDGSSMREIYTGALVLRVTNTDTGAFYDADASGTALIDYGTDGSMTWYVVGPVLIGYRDGGGTLPRGLWVIDGVFRLAFSPTGFKTLTMVVGHTDNVCDHLA